MEVIVLVCLICLIYLILILVVAVVVVVVVVVLVVFFYCDRNKTITVCLSWFGAELDGAKPIATKIWQQMCRWSRTSPVTA